MQYGITWLLSLRAVVVQLESSTSHSSKPSTSPNSQVVSLERQVATLQAQVNSLTAEVASLKQVCTD